MTLGRLTLVARGLQDTFVTGSPSMSFFNMKYASESVYEVFVRDCSTETNNQLNYGETLRFKIPRVGDLVSKIFLRLILPASYTYTSLQRVFTDTFVLYSLLETVDLYIGGQLIERLTGEYIHNYIKLYFSKNELNSVVSTSEINVQAGTQGFIRYDQFSLLPLPFYFYNKPGKEIPLLSLTKQDVEVVIKFVPKPPVVSLPDLTSFSIPVEFINIDEASRNEFTRRGVMYKIEQVQMEYGYIDPGENTKRIPVHFINPVRELSVCIQQTSYGDIENSRYIKNFGNYRNENENVLSSNNEVGYFLQAHHIHGLDITFNGNKVIDRKSSGDARYLSSYVPQKYYANPDNAQFFKQYVYPWALNPLYQDSVGHVNMSRISEKEIILYMTQSDVNRSYRIYATSYNILMIKDGISGLLFTHNSNYKYKIPRGLPQAVSETNTPPASLPDTDGTTFYYAITSDQPIVGLQLFERYNPSFPNSLTLFDNAASSIFSGPNVFFQGVDILDPLVYAPASKVNFIDDIDTNVNVAGAAFLTRYHVQLVNDTKFIFSTQPTNALFMRAGFLTNTTSPGTTAYNPVTTTDRLGYSNLSTSQTINIYYSTEFFDSGDIATWLAGATRIEKTIRQDFKTESDGYYYFANAELEGGLFRYDDVLFGRTYDIRIFFNVDISESLANNVSTVTITYSDVPASRSQNVKVYRSSAKTTLITENTSTGSTGDTFTFEEDRLRGLYAYHLVYTDGAVTIETTLDTITSGKEDVVINLVDSITAIDQTTNELLVTFYFTNDTEVPGSVNVYNSATLIPANLLGSNAVTGVLNDVITVTQNASLANDYSYYATLTYSVTGTVSAADSITYDGNLIANVLQSNVTYMGFQSTAYGRSFGYSGQGDRIFKGTSVTGSLQQYSTTKAFNPVGATLDLSKNVRGGSGTVTGFSWNDDGSYFAIVERDGTPSFVAIWRNDTGTPWSIDGTITSYVVLRIDTLGVSNPQGLSWVGNYLYVIAGTEIVKFDVDLVTPSISLTADSFSLGHGSACIKVSRDGKRVIVGNSPNLSLSVYFMGTPFTLSTCSLAGELILHDIIPSADRPFGVLPEGLDVDDITFQNLCVHSNNNNRTYYITFDRGVTNIL